MIELIIIVIRTKMQMKQREISFFIMLFIAYITEEVKYIFNKNSYTSMAYKDINKINKFICVQKDELFSFSHSNIVYKINYKDCNASCVGQTDRILKARIKEQMNHINWNTTQHSVIIRCSKKKSIIFSIDGFSNLYHT